MGDALLVGLTALQAHRRAMEVTSHNIANAATPGYTRQRGDLSAAAPEEGSPGQVGRGVQLADIARLQDGLVVERLRAIQSESGRLETTAGTMETVEAVFDELGDASFSSTVDNVFASLEDLAANPESNAMRAGAISSLTSFTTLTRGIGDRLAELRAGLGTQMATEVQQINGLTQRITAINDQIRLETLRGAAPNDLLDTRDQLIADLSKHADLRVRVDPKDGTATVELSGRMLVSPNGRIELAAVTNGTYQVTFGDTGATAEVAGGSLGALVELGNRTLPGIQGQFDDLVGGVIRRINALHATGTSASHQADEFTSEVVMPAAQAGANLDDPAQTIDSAGVGIPASFLPSFTDANGVAQARNLTINVLDRASGVATKYTLRYDPGTGSIPASRSLNDLVSAINTGRGGGFALVPASGSGGVAGLSASLVAVNGGYRLHLQADPGTAIDFSPALDVRPTATAWTGGQVTVTGSDASLAGKRVIASVESVGLGTQLRIYTLDPVTGAHVPYPAAGSDTAATSGATLVGGLTFTAAAGTYRPGESFALDITSSGTIATVGPTAGAHTQASDWVAGDADLTLSGRYTGGLGYAPGQQWGMRVVSGGTVGATTGAPVVEFSYYANVDGVAVPRTVQRVLDATALRAPIAVADGVTAAFTAGGNLTTGKQVAFTVDAQPDQAGLLPALGINGLLTGHSASTAGVDRRIADNPSQLDVGRTRTAGDNSNALGFNAMRGERLFGGGTTNLDDFYRGMVSDVAVQVEQTTRLQENQTVLEQTLSRRRQELSGVSIDDEVGQLIVQQQAYAAAARVVSTARENISTLMDIIK